MRRRRGLWLVFAASAVAVAGAMAWITADLLGLERAQEEARADAVHQEKLRLALWRMDSWLGPAIVASSNAARDAPATLLRAAFSITRDGDVRPLRGGDADSERIVRAIDLAEVERRYDANTVWLKQLVGLPGDLAATTNEYAQRARSNLAQIANAQVEGGELVGGGEAPTGAPLFPIWVRVGAKEPALVFTRRRYAESARSGQIERGDLAVFVVDWALTQRGLREQVADLLPEVTLRPVSRPESSAGNGFILATAPIAIDAPRAVAAPLPLLTPTRTTLALAWLALAASFAAVGITLRRTVDLSERRSRFASSVTHELRTPLTTFRLYSEMLADGMVTDPAQRQTYLDTLKSESTRLANLVENVLAYARVEEGRMPLRRERIAVADLLLRVAPPLERRAKEAGMTLSVDAGDAATTVADVDPDVVGQILFNLVDNACKYTAISREREIAIGAVARAGVVRFEVRDHGPGIAPDRVRAAFAPFERAGRPAGDTVPGIGIGLALSRALARDLGGDLAYEPADGGGACFVLTLPSA